MRIIFLGAPGSGKGTQAARLREKMGIVKISSGDIFREAVRMGKPLGLRAKEYMDRGALVPDDITVAMIQERLSQPDCAQGFILDGFPRNHTQVLKIDEAFGGKTQAVDFVVYLRVSRERLIERLTGRRVCCDCNALFHVKSARPKIPGRCDKCGGELFIRADDQDHVVRHRQEVYERETASIVDHFRRQDQLIEIDGEQDIDAIFSELCDKLGVSKAQRQ